MRKCLLPILLATLLCAGCVGKRQQAQSLIDEGIATSTALENYYQTLLDQNDSRAAMERFVLILDGGRPSVADPSVRKSLTARRESARRLKALYVRLGTIMKGGADPRLDQDIDAFQNAVSQVASSSLQIDSEITIDPVQILQDLVGDIEIAQRERRVEHRAPIAERAVERIANLFEREAASFDRIQTSYLVSRQEFGRTMVDRSLAVPTDMLKGPLSELGLRFVTTPVPPTALNAVKNEIDDRTAKDLEEAPGKTQEVLAALRRLERAHEAFLPNKKKKAR